MNSVLTREPSSPWRIAPVGAVIVGVAVVLAALGAATRLLERDVSYVSITIENPLPYQVNIDVAGTERDGWLDLASIDPGRTRTVAEVLDQGDEWVFRFSYGGAQAGEVTIGREALSGSGWRITVPSAVGDRLHEAGMSESAM